MESSNLVQEVTLTVSIKAVIWLQGADDAFATVKRDPEQRAGLLYLLLF